MDHKQLLCAVCAHVSFIRDHQYHQQPSSLIGDNDFETTFWFSHSRRVINIRFKGSQKITSPQDGHTPTRKTAIAYDHNTTTSTTATRCEIMRAISQREEIGFPVLTAVTISRGWWCAVLCCDHGPWGRGVARVFEGFAVLGWIRISCFWSQKSILNPLGTIFCFFF